MSDQPQAKPLWPSQEDSRKLGTLFYHQTPRDLRKRFIFIGGSPTSLENSGEQWDFPNAWPPLQAFFIQGMDRIGTPEASELAYHFAKIYLRSNYKGFHDLGVMYEKVMWIQSQ